jgi:hypothetical protein
MNTPSTTEALARVPRADIIDLDPTETKRKLEAISQFQGIVRRELKDGLDFGVIPGTNKPTLLKPGAEKLAKLLNCYDDYEIIERIEDWGKPLFRYLIRCTLIEMSSGTKVSSGLGECNSYESKYRYRWIEEENLPLGVRKEDLKSRDGRKTLFEFDFALEKRETTGKYGKPREYWDAFDKAVKDGTARRVEKETKSGKKMFGHEMTIGTTQYQAPNPDIFDQINTILKMAKKRALVDAALSAGRLSDLFTQDLEDFAEYEPAASPVHPATAAAPAPKPSESKPAPQQAADKSRAQEFPEDSANADAEAMAEPDQLDDITKHIANLKILGKTENFIWQEIYKKARDKGREIAELSEMTFAQADYVSNYLGAWIENIRTTRAAKNGAKK